MVKILSSSAFANLQEQLNMELRRTTSPYKLHFSTASAGTQYATTTTYSVMIEYLR